MSESNTYFAEITECRFGHSVQVCQRVGSPKFGPGIYRAYLSDDDDGIDTSWLVVDVNAPRWRPTQRWAGRLARRLVRRHNARAVREAAVVTVTT